MDQIRSKALLGFAIALTLLCIGTQVIAFAEIMTSDYSLEALLNESEVEPTPYSSTQIGLAISVFVAATIAMAVILRHFGPLIRVRIQWSEMRSILQRRKSLFIYSIFGVAIVIILISALINGTVAISLPTHAPVPFEPGMRIWSALMMPIGSLAFSVLGLWLQIKHVPDLNRGPILNGLIYNSAVGVLMVILSLPTGNIPSLLLWMGILGMVWSIPPFILYGRIAIQRRGHQSVPE